jgi:hypothetical protein
MSFCAFRLIVSCCLLGLFFDPNDGDITYPRNLGEYLLECIAWRPGKHNNIGIVNITYPVELNRISHEVLKRIGTWHEQMSLKIQDVPKNENRGKI